MKFKQQMLKNKSLCYKMGYFKKVKSSLKQILLFWQIGAVKLTSIEDF